MAPRFGGTKTAPEQAMEATGGGSVGNRLAKERIAHEVPGQLRERAHLFRTERRHLVVKFAAPPLHHGPDEIAYDLRPIPL
jgi:hypothetical protein